MDPAKKAALLKRLADGRMKTKASRTEANEKGLPDPKPRKKRAPKNKNGNAETVDSKMAIPDPMNAKPARETIAPIDGTPATAKNKVSATPVDPTENVTSKIDVPNLPNEKGRNQIVQNAEKLPEAKDPKDLSTSGTTKKYDVNDMLMNKETGTQVIEAQYPGQEESILKVLKKNRKENKPLAPKSEPNPTDKTVEKHASHVPDMKAVEGRREPFSFSALKKALYQS